MPRVARQPVLPARDGRRAARAWRARDPRADEDGEARKLVSRSSARRASSSRCRRRSSSSSPIACTSCPERARASSTGSRSPAVRSPRRDLDRARAPRRRRARSRACCARGLCDRKGDDVDFRHPLTRDVAYLALDPPSARAHAPRARRAPRDDAARARALGGDRGAPPRRAASARELAAELLPRGRARGAHRATRPSSRSATTSARSRSCRPTTCGASSPTRRSKRSTASSAGGASAASTSAALRSLARKLAAGRGGSPSRSCAPRASTSTRATSRAGCPSRSSAAERRARVAEAPELEVEAQSIQSELLRELGDMQGALAACDRALEVVAAPRRSARARKRRGARTRGRPPPARRPRARGGRMLRRGDRRLSAQRRAPARGPRQERARVRDVRPGALRRRDRARARRRSASTSRLAAASRSPRRSPTSASRTRASAIMPRALAYLKRARDAHERYGDQDYRADTLLVSAESSSRPAISTPPTFSPPTPPRSTRSPTRPTTTSTSASCARASRDDKATSRAPFVTPEEARKTAEGHALVSFFLYATAIEARLAARHGRTRRRHRACRRARCEGVETIQGSEFGTAIRSQCYEALSRAGSPHAAYAHERALAHVKSVSERHPRSAPERAVHEPPDGGQRAGRSPKVTKRNHRLNALKGSVGHAAPRLSPGAHR